MNWKEFLAGVAAATPANESPTTLSDAQLLLFDVMDTVRDAAALLWLGVMKLLSFGYCNIRFSMREMDWRCRTDRLASVERKRQAVFAAAAGQSTT